MPAPARNVVRYPGQVPSGSSRELFEVLERVGLPGKVLTIFRAVENLYKTTGAGAEYQLEGLVVGYSREGDEICVDLDSGRIVLLAEWNLSYPLTVNRDIRSFRDCLNTIQAMTPFYGPDRDLDVAEAAESRVRSALCAIDELATACPDGFWSTFLDDLGIGDYPAREE